MIPTTAVTRLMNSIRFFRFKDKESKDMCSTIIVDLINIKLSVLEVLSNFSISRYIKLLKVSCTYSTYTIHAYLMSYI